MMRGFSRKAKRLLVNSVLMLVILVVVAINFTTKPQSLSLRVKSIVEFGIQNTGELRNVKENGMTFSSGLL